MLTLVTISPNVLNCGQCEHWISISGILSLLLWLIGSDTIMKDSTCTIIVANLHWTQFIIESDDKIGYSNCLDTEADWHLL